MAWSSLILCALSPFASLYDNDCANCCCPTFCDVCWILPPDRLFNFCTCLYGFKVWAHPRVCADCSCAPLCDDGLLTMPWLIYLLLKCRHIAVFNFCAYLYCLIIIWALPLVSTATIVLTAVVKVSATIFAELFTLWLWLLIVLYRFNSLSSSWQRWLRSTIVLIVLNWSLFLMEVWRWTVQHLCIADFTTSLVNCCLRRQQRPLRSTIIIFVLKWLYLSHRTVSFD